MTAIDKLKEVSAFLKSKGIEDAAKEAEILIIETLRISKSKLYAGSFEMSEDESKQIDALASRRASQRAASVYPWPCGVLRLEDKGWAGRPYSKA